MQRIGIASLLVMLFIFSSAYAACSYVPSFTVTGDSVTTLFPNAGDMEKFGFSIESTEPYSGVMQIYIEKGGIRYPLKEETVYITPGINGFSYEFQVPQTLSTGVYLLHVKADGFDYRMPLVVNGTTENETIWTEEGLENITISVKSDAQVNVKVEEQFSDGRASNKQYAVLPIDGIATVTEKVCNDCKLSIVTSSGGTLAQVQRSYGDYTESYVKVIELSKNKVALETCASAGYDAYLDGESKGRMVGIGRLEKELQGGYESVDVKMSDKGTILERKVDLGAFVSKNITTAVKITAKTPFTIAVTATDEFGRDAESDGEISITDEKGNTVYMKASFIGQMEKKVNLADGKYTVAYNGVATTGEAKAIVPEQKPPESQPFELIPKDLVPVITVILLITLFIIIVVWTSRWRKAEPRGKRQLR